MRRIVLAVAVAAALALTACGGHKEPKKEPQVEAANKIGTAQSYVAAGRTAAT